MEITGTHPPWNDVFGKIWLSALESQRLNLRRLCVRENRAADNMMQERETGQLGECMITIV
jgi:hypothetical protein